VLAGRSMSLLAALRFLPFFPCPDCLQLCDSKLAYYQASLHIEPMTWLRLILLFSCLGPAAWHLDAEQRAGRFQHIDDLFLDFLVANARERLSQPASAENEDQVSFVALREEQKGEYAAWPPPPLDWQTLFKALQPYEPRVLVIATPLNWGRPSPEFVPAVAEALFPFAQVVQGIEIQPAETAPANPPFMGDLTDVLPRFQRVDGPLSSAPAFSALITAPDPALRPSGDMGLLAVRQSAKGWSMPYALLAEDTLVPCLLAQTFSRLTSSPYALHRLRLGPGAGAYLSDGTFVPLQNDGSLAVDSATSVPVINALDLMTGTLADALSPADKDALGKGKVIVIGPDHEENASPRLAYLHAQALAQTLNLPKLQKLTQIQQWIAWGIAALAATWLVLRVRRGRALWMGIGLIFCALVISFLAFQASLLWCPPTIPAALIAIGAILGMIIGRSAAKVAAAPSEASPL